MGDTPNRTLTEALRGNLDLDGATLRIALFSTATAYTFDPDTDEFVSDILDGGTTAQELQGSSGYTGSADRKTLQNVTFAQDNTNDRAILSSDNTQWQDVSSTEDIQGWIVYKQVGGDDSTPGDDPVIIVVNDDQADAPSELPLTTTGTDIEVAVDPDGRINLSTP